MILPILLFFAAVGDHGFGVLPSKPLPDVQVTTEDNRRLSLRELTRDRAVAVQFVFADCVTVCPLLGSLFRSVEKRVDPASSTMLLSITVNPDRDTPDRLKEWLSGFRQGRNWHAIRVAKEDLPAILEVFGQKVGPVAAHSSQVFFVKHNGEVFGRTTGLPDSAGVAGILQRLP